MDMYIYILFNEGNVLISFPKINLKKDVLYISYLNLGGWWCRDLEYVHDKKL